MGSLAAEGREEWREGRDQEKEKLSVKGDPKEKGKKRSGAGAGPKEFEERGKLSGKEFPRERVGAKNLKKKGKEIRLKRGAKRTV